MFMYKKVFKRFFDIILSLIALPFLGIIFVIVAPIIYCEDKGSPFYNGKRLGKNGKIFKMYKFRSMKLNAPDIRNADGSTFNTADDPRLTKIGKFIRTTSIDELTQILNVLLGDMSFIGPRPDLPEHFSLYEGNEHRKLEVRPGISGYSQAFFRNSIEWKERIANDVFYIDHLSYWMDVKIFFKTIQSILFFKSIYVEIKKVDEDEYTTV